MFHNFCGRDFEMEFYEAQFPHGTIIAGEGLNVVNRAIDVAFFLGYQTVTIVGCDNGFPVDGHFYADGSDNEVSHLRPKLTLGNRQWYTTDDMVLSATDIVQKKRKRGGRLQVWGQGTITGTLVEKMPSDRWMQRNLVRWER
jgi:hypothetical protein